MTTPASYTEALERALGRVIADTQRQFDVYVAKTDALISQFQARVLETEMRCTALEDATRSSIAARLAELHDGADVDKAEVERLVLEAVERGMPPPLELPDIPGMVQEAVGAATAALQPPVLDVGPMVDAAVEAAVGALPAPPAGKDADPAVIARMVADAVAEIPAPEPGEPGKDADPEEVARLVLAAMPSRDELRGPPGRLPVVTAWVDRVHYEGEVVAHRGATWQAACDTGRQPPHSDWICLAARGDDARSIDVRGTYSETEDYRWLDIVALNGGSFIALRDGPGECPGEGWQLLTSPGKRGQKADPEEVARIVLAAMPSAEELRGPKGDDASEVVGFYRDGDGLVLAFADGRELKALVV